MRQDFQLAFRAPCFFFYETSGLCIYDINNAECYEDQVDSFSIHLWLFVLVYFSYPLYNKSIPEFPYLCFALFHNLWWSHHVYIPSFMKLCLHWRQWKTLLWENRAILVRIVCTKIGKWIFFLFPKSTFFKQFHINIKCKRAINNCWHRNRKWNLVWCLKMQYFEKSKVNLK